MPQSPKRPPGFLRASINPDVVMMICTAGHVDHGKTQLVKLLTGCNTDRLKAEQERGMTIELGFAPCFLGGNLCVGIVDVPGHEKFVKNMVAGVSGIEMAILVIAADDGIMPQTVEHLQIMELLGVRKGLVALTKIDLVSEDDVRERTEEIRQYLRGTFLEGAPIFPLSSETFVGYEEFYGVLVERVKSLVRTPVAGVFRMPIERAFARPGFGTVITGIPVAGTVEIGAQIEVVPSGQTGRIRGIQRFLRDASDGACGQCLALNVPDLGKNPPERGEVVCLPGYLRPAQYFSVRLKTIPGLKSALRNAEAVKFHTGTIEAPGKLFLLEDKSLEENQEGLATVGLDQPVAAAVHDRFILRRPSPPATVAGGEILAVSSGDVRPRKAQILPQIKQCIALFQGVDPASELGADKKIERFLLYEQKRGGTVAEISKATLLPPVSVKSSLARLIENEKASALSDDFFIHLQAERAYLEEVESWLRKAASERKALSVSVADLRNDLDCPPILWNRILEEIERRNWARRRGDWLILPSAIGGMDEGDRRLMNLVLQVYEQTGFHSPRPEELPGRLNAPPAKIASLLRHLCNEGLLIRLAKNVILHHTHFKQAQGMVVRTIQEKGSLNSGDFKDYIGSSRKYALSILDYLDSRRVTVRIDNDRKLLPDFQKRLL